MKKRLFNILMASVIIAIIGFIMDSDVKEPSMIMRFLEFFAMIGIVFSLISLVYFSATFLLKKLQRM